MTPQDIPVVLQNEKKGILTLEDGRLDVIQLSRDGRPPKRLLSCPVRFVLRARLVAAQKHGSGAASAQSPIETSRQRSRLDLHVLLQKAKNTEMRLSKIHVLIESINLSEAEEWCNGVMKEAYTGLKPFRNVLLIVNPVGGKGKAKGIVKKIVLPILEAAGCNVDLRQTTHRLHAQEIAANMELSYDVVAVSSGDGTVYEVLNGFAGRSDARKALKTPIAPIATGSACAIAINLFGVIDTFNIELQCLNIIKGQSLPIDLCSVFMLPNHERRVSFISQALGLMVDLDIGTEHLRWLGDSRFLYGFLRGMIGNKNFKCRLKMKVVEHDKVEMARNAREQARISRNHENVVSVSDRVDGARMTLSVGDEGRAGDVGQVGGEMDKPDGAEESVDFGPVPPASALEPDETWMTIESNTTKPKKFKQAPPDAGPGGWVDGSGILYVYAGLMPWVARDLLQWPVITSGQGLIDIVIQSIVPRTTLASAITGAEKGEAYWMDCQHYFKVSAFVVENLDKENQKNFTIDGEAFPFDSFHVEVMPRAATLLSLDGYFYLSDFLQVREEKVK